MPRYDHHDPRSWPRNQVFKINDRSKVLWSDLDPSDLDDFRGYMSNPKPTIGPHGGLLYWVNSVKGQVVGDEFYDVVTDGLHSIEILPDALRREGTFTELPEGVFRPPMLYKGKVGITSYGGKLWKGRR